MAQLAKLKVVRVERKFIGSLITVEAETPVRQNFDTLMGTREFYLPEGKRLTLAVKGKDWRRGDTVTMSELVTLARDWSKIPYRFSWMTFAPTDE